MAYLVPECAVQILCICAEHVVEGQGYAQEQWLLACDEMEKHAGTRDVEPPLLLPIERLDEVKRLADSAFPEGSKWS